MTPDLESADDFILFEDQFETEYEYEYDPVAVVTFVREVTSHISAFDANVERTTTLTRAVDSHLRRLVADAEAETIMVRTVDSHLSAFLANAEREGMAKTRAVDSHIGRVVADVSFGFLEWRVDGERVDVGVGVELTPKQLTIAWQTNDPDAWRYLDRAGDVVIEVGFAGRFRALDRAGADAPVLVRPAVGQQPPFDVTFEGVVTEFNETQETPDRSVITLVLHRISARLDEVQAVDEDPTPWGFDFEEGGRVGVSEERVGQIAREGESARSRITVPLLLTPEQAATVADAAGVPDGVVRRDVTDGEDVWSDESFGRQTVTVTAPTGAMIASDEYVVLGWTIQQTDAEDRWQTELVLGHR